MSKTKIEWCVNSDRTHGDTWNPVQGCKTNPPCPYCYARKIALRFNMNFDETRINQKAWDDGMAKYCKTKKSKTIFIGSMSDIFGSWSWTNDNNQEISYPIVPKKIVRDCYEINRIRKESGKDEHVFLFLTKNPKAYMKLDAETITNNMYFGVTLEHFQDVKAKDMLKVIGKFGLNAFVSFEPILEYNKISQDTKDLVRNCSFYILGYETNNGKVIPPQGENRLFFDTLERVLVPLNDNVFIKDSILSINSRETQEILLETCRNLPWL